MEASTARAMEKREKEREIRPEKEKKKRKACRKRKKEKAPFKISQGDNLESLQTPVYGEKKKKTCAGKEEGKKNPNSYHYVRKRDGDGPAPLTGKKLN